MQDRNLKFSSSVKGNRYLELKEQRQDLAALYIKQGKMADPEQKYSLGSAPALVGECMDMCPLFERHEREFQTGGLDKTEKIPGTENVDHQKAVKRYRRSAAGDPPPLPCDVRPPKKTLDYLLEEILAKYGLIDSYSFVRDRARAIRNDLTLQNYRGQEAVDLCEKIARYHILTSHELCDVEGISLQQEHEQMRKTLQSLMEFYREMNDQGIQMPNEAEFQAYYILTHAYSNETASKAETLSEKVFYDPQVQFALQIQSMMARTNEEYIQGRASENGSLNLYSAIFKELEKTSTSYLMACCIHLSFIDIRRGALKAMQRAFYCFPDDNSSIWPIEELMLLLGYDSEQEVVETLDYYEIPYENGIALIGKQIGSSDHKMNKGNFTEGQRVSLTPRKSARMVTVKRIDISEVDIIQGRSKSIPERKKSQHNMYYPSIISNQLIMPTNSNDVSAPSTYQANPALHIFQTHSVSHTPIPKVEEFAKIPPITPAKKQIPDEAIVDYTKSFFDDFVSELLYQDPFTHQILQDRLNIINILCWEFVYCTIDQVAHEFVSERFRINQSVSLYLDTLQTIISEIVDEVIDLEIAKVGRNCMSHFGALREYVKRYQMLGWDRWRFFVIRNKERIHSKQRNAKKLLLNLKGFSSVTPKKRGTSINNKLPVIHKTSQNDNHGLDLLKPLDFVSILAQSKCGISSWKLSFSVPSTPRIVQNFEQFLNFWLQSKLSTSIDQAFGYVTKNLHGKAFHVVTQSVVGDEIRQELLPNHLSLCSGVNSVIFALDPYIQNHLVTQYWKKQSDRLFAFISALPLQAKIPLLIVYWTNTSSPDISESEIMSHLGLAHIIKDGPISNFQFLNLVATSLSFESVSLSNLLGDQVCILMQKCDNIESKLHFDLQKDIDESKAMDFFHDLVIKSQDKLQDINLGHKSLFYSSEDHKILDLLIFKSQSRLFRHFIVLFNSYLMIIQKSITDFDLQCIVYPSREFCDLDLANGVKIDWNSDAVFSNIRSSFSQLQIYDPEVVLQDSHEKLDALYSNYANLAKYEVSETQRILEIYPISEWLAKFVKLYTTKVLNRLMSELTKIRPPFLAKVFRERIQRYIYVMQRDTYLLLEKIIGELSNIQNLQYTSQFRNARKRYKSVDSSPKAEDARKKMKDLIAIAQKEIENVSQKLSQV